MREGLCRAIVLAAAACLLSAPAQAADLTVYSSLPLVEPASPQGAAVAVFEGEVDD